MGYAELLRALDEDAEREIRSLADGAAREAQRLVDEAHRVAGQGRTEALARAQRTQTEAIAAAVAQARRDGQHDLLRVMRHGLAEIEAACAGRLALDAALTLRLVDELLPELAGGGALVVDPAHVEIVRRRVGERITVTAGAAGDVRGVIADRRLELDNSLGARLRRAWPALEPELALILFGSEHADA